MTYSLYRIFGVDDVLLYVGISRNPAARIKSHMARAKWADDIAAVTFEKCGGRGEAEIAEANAIRDGRPIHNIRHAGRAEENPAYDFIARAGRDRLMKFTGIKYSSLTNAAARGVIPARWAELVALFCRKHGEYCPVKAFSFLGDAARKDDRCITELMFSGSEGGAQ